MNSKLNNAAKIMAKIFEVVLWMGTAVMIAGLLTSIFARDWLFNMLQSGLDNGTLTIGGFNIDVVTESGEVIPKALIIAFAAGIFEMPLMAMVFRNIYLIFKSEKPFNKDNVRMVREIGIFAIAAPVVELVISIIGAVIIGGTEASVVVNGNGIVFGIIVLSLSQYFAYGAALEKEVDGLL